MRIRGFVVDAAIVAVAAGVAFWHPAAPWVEANYTNGFYSRLDPVLRAVTSPLPFALGDALLVAFALLLIGLWVMTLRRGPARARLGRILGLVTRTLALLAVLFVWFEGFWGLNYDRVPVNDKVIVKRSAVDTIHVDAYADHVLDMLDANVLAAHRDPPDEASVQAALEPTFEATISRLGDQHAFGLPSVKPTIFNAMLGSTGDSGFMDPWTHEVNLYTGQLFFERPATFAHEWAHAAGFADESEANYVSVLSCINSPLALARYSGWLLVWFNLPSDVHAKHHVLAQVRDDVEAIKARYRRQVRPVIARAQQAAYDKYLRANRVNAGIDSYRLFVRWMIGATYDAQGLPAVEPPG